MGEVEAIRKVHSREQLVEYLSLCLGYQMTDVPYLAGQLDIPPKPSEAIQLIRLLSDYEKAFQIYLFETTLLTRTTIRSILEPFYRHHPAGDYLFIFTKDYTQLVFVGPLRILRPEKTPALQLRILPLEPANVYHTDLEVLQGIALTYEEQHPEIIRKKHKEAFSVERVTDEFFENYKLILGEFKKTLTTQHHGTSDQVHAFAQQFLNRLMFLYFLQRKGWLKWGDGTPDRHYMRTLWRRYQEKSPRHGFYSTWLSPLFFQAFNKRTSLLPLELPGDIKASFLNMPFLNGGLFTEDEVLDKLGFDMLDEMVAILFDQNIDGTYPGFLERYNFTIQESLPLEVEVAVDPEMLGRVYESLINEEDRHQAGIFYTPRIEIDYMCRLSLIEYLHEATALSREILIPIVMAPASEDGRKELAMLADSEINQLRGALDSVRVVDPAVGSGSFLVGMMNVMVQLYRAIAEHQGFHENEFALKKRIISQNLYGVDVKDWAVRVCELRLWLSLIIESEESQMDIYNHPLLPNLTFKARQGDSLVEEIAGVPLSLRADYAHIPPPLKQQIHTIVDKKADYFRGDRSVTKHDIESLEHELLRNVIGSKVKAIDAEIRKLESPQQKAFQAGLEQIRGGLDITGAILKQEEEARAKVQPRIDALREEKTRLQKVAASIGKKGEKDYFLWDIDFAEVFLENGGFDICIGNPPYVRQEEIAPPLLKAEDYDPDRWREIKREYKEQLERAVKTCWGNAVTRVDKKSDLYVYFYYQGLSLLRPGGVFCFINSNSWLDVGYGGSLQQFLLKNIDIYQVIDNHSRRSFKESDVNTVIVLLQRPKDGKWEALKDNTSKFIAYRVPFEAGVNAENLLLQEWTDSVQSVPEFRVYPIKHEELWRGGLEVSEEAETPQMEMGAEHGEYIGDRWGGKYLRAPDIFFVVLEKAKKRIMSLGEIGRVRYPIKTGINEFFYVTDEVIERFGIEREFLIPVVKSPKDFRGLRLRETDINVYLFSCELNRKELINKGKDGALSYIAWGEKQVTKERQKTSGGVPWPYVPSVAGRMKWYTIENIGSADVVCSRFFDRRFFFGFSNFPVVEDQTFYGLMLNPTYKLVKLPQIALLNTTLSYLFIEVLGRVALGQGVLQYARIDMERLLAFDAIAFGDTVQRSLVEALEALSDRPIMPIFEEINQQDRRRLDSIIFREIGMKPSEEEELYTSVAALVRDRLLKAESV